MAMAHSANMGDQFPLRGVVLCCTALAQEIRTSLAETAAAMGAVHKLDLTSDVTHLIVGSITTPKYRYVAKERPDIRVLAPSFIEAVRIAWMAGGAVDVETLLKEHTLPPFSGLLICLTGWPDPDVRRNFENQIRDNGATYSGDLVKQVTHLVAAKPEGAKYTHAKQWGIKVVGLKWLTDSLKRGMALDESLYLPEVPEEQQGRGAYRTEPKKPAVKRGRDAELSATGEDAGRRKLRKVASMRLEGQSQELWRSVSEHEVQVETTELDAWNEESQTMRDDATTDEGLTKSKPDLLRTTRTGPTNPLENMFSGLYVLLHGFDNGKRMLLEKFLVPNGAVIVDCYDMLDRASENQSCKSRMLLVPHADATKLPDVPPYTVVATEWWLERCVHYRQHLDPEADPLSRPFAKATVTGFSNLTITTTGFRHVDLRQTAEAVRLMGATYQEHLLPSTSVLVCGDKTVRKEKAIYASKHKIPVVSADWLWASFHSRKMVPVEEYIISLPAFDPSEYSGTPSTRGPTPNESRRSVDDVKRTDVPHPQRRSNTRQRHPTPSLTLKPSKAAELPPKVVQFPKPRVGPFVLEDDDQDDDCTPTLADDQPVPPPPQDASHQDVARPLREISTNKSQPKRDASANQDEQDQDKFEKHAVQLPTRTAPASPEKHLPSENIENADAQDLRLDLVAKILKTRASPKPNSTDPLRRKQRKLGRNLSSSNNNHMNRSDSVPSNLSDAANGEDHHFSAADGFSSVPAAIVVPPSTQLGYETPEAVAHREQMGRKMGIEGLGREAEGLGVRVASLGTVRDSERLSGSGSGERKMKVRARK